MFENFRDKGRQIKKIWSNQSGIFLLMEVAAILLIVTMAFNYIQRYFFHTFFEDNAVYTWEYVYNNRSGDDYDGAWNTATKIQPVSDTKSGKYLHLRHSFSSSDQERVLTVITDYAPVRICIDGEEVYNNHYEEDAYVGNCYNAVVLPASSRAQTVNVTATLPFSAKVQTYLNENAKNPGIDIGTGSVLGGMIVLSGMVLLVISLILLLKKKGAGRLLLLSLSVIVCGVAVFGYYFSVDSYLINFTRWYNLVLVLSMVSMAVILMEIMGVVKAKKIGFRMGMLLLFLLSVLLLLPEKARLLQAGAALACICGAVISAFLARQCERALQHRVKYVSLIFVALGYMTLLYIAMAVCVLQRNSSIGFLYGFGNVLIFILLFFAAFQQCQENGNIKDAWEKMEDYSKCVERAADFVKEIFQCRNMDEFYQNAVSGLKALVEMLCPGINSDDVGIGIAERTETGYQEVFRQKISSSCNYSLIENYYDTTGNTLHFTETYFDLLFIHKEQVQTIFHFENIKDGQSELFGSVMEMAGSSMGIAYEWLMTPQPEPDVQEKRLLSMAEKLETRSGGEKEHLKNVRTYTKILCTALGFTSEEAEMVSKASAFHDIGKMVIPESIIGKRGHLMEMEREIIKRHTDLGFRILSSFQGKTMETAAIIARDHHEQYDGYGYRGLTGEVTPLYVQIVTMADAFDALTTKRNYKEAWSLEKAYDYILQNRGVIFNPEVVLAFQDCYQQIAEYYEENSR